MTTVEWAQGITKGWKNPDNWGGGVVPGAGDVAIIETTPAAVTHGAYHVAVGSRVDVDTVVMDQANATLSVISTLTENHLMLDAGMVQLAGGSLSGTVTQAQEAAGLEIKQGTTGTLSNVTWISAPDSVLAPVFRFNGHVAEPAGSLVIAGGFTVLNSNGGAGAATIDGNVALQGVSSLDNATLNFDNHTVTADSASLTLGAGLELVNANMTLTTSSATLTNLGLIDGGSITAPVFVNNGILQLADFAFSPQIHTNLFINDGTLTSNGLITPLKSKDNTQIVNNGLIEAKSSSGISVGGTHSEFTNNGTVQVDTGGELDLTAAGFAAPGAESTFIVDGVLGLDGPLTTAELTGLIAQQHISFGQDSGISVFGTLDNTNATLTLGSDFPTLFLSRYAPEKGETIIGGTLMDPGGAISINGFDSDFIQLHLQDVSYQGPGIAVTGGLELDGGTTVTGSDGTPATLTLGAPSSLLILDANEALTGVAIDCSVNEISIQEPTIELGKTEVLDSDAVTLAANSQIRGITNQGEGTLGVDSVVTISNVGSAGVQAQINVAKNEGRIIVTPGSAVILDGPASGDTFDNSGTVTANDATVVLYAAPKNTGQFEMTGGTLALDYADTQLSSLTALTLDGVELQIIRGTVSLGGKTFALGTHGITGIDVRGGGITDGTLTLSSGQTLTSTVPFAGAPTISAMLVNDGNIEVTQLAVSGVSGTGTFDLSAAPNTNAPVLTYIGPSPAGVGFGAGETVNFESQGAQLSFASGASASFAGTLQGFSVGDSVRFLQSDPAMSAEFSGKSIVIDFKSGVTVTLATQSALSGQLSISSSNFLSTVTYSSGSLEVADWSAAGALPAAPKAAAPATGFYRLWQEISRIDQVMPHAGHAIN